MVDATRTILTAIKSELASELPSFRELPYVNDVSKNSLRQAVNAFGVKPGRSIEESGVIRFITYTQTFGLVATGVYANDSVTDAGPTSKALELLKAIKQAHRRLIQTKCGAPQTVINVKNLSINEPVYDTTEKLISVEATLDVTYRIQI